MVTQQRGFDMDCSPNPPKRRKLTGDGKSIISSSGIISSDSIKTTPALSSEVSAFERSISPPLVRKKIAGSSSSPIVIPDTCTSPTLISSPVSLTRVNSLSSTNNVDIVCLRDILGDPLIQECWAFNYLFDVDFLMTQFDPDVKDLVQVKIVHGSWKKEDSNRLRLQDAAARYKNVQAITAYMPEAYGTHHSKVFILFKHDDTAQSYSTREPCIRLTKIAIVARNLPSEIEGQIRVPNLYHAIIIHTANIVPGDWRMCQAVWRSSALPLQAVNSPSPDIEIDSFAPIGSGRRFKHDLLSYLFSYGNAKTGPLVSRLRLHDFGNVRAALVASTPGKQNPNIFSQKDSLWGWPSLKRILSSIPIGQGKDRPQVVTQVSSVASIGEKWATMFFEILSTTPRTAPSTPKPKMSLVFPTPSEIRKSVEGYSCGGSIHMRTQSAAQLKQLNFLRPMLCHWAGDGEGKASATVREAGRRRAAPHIKTYIRFSDATMTNVDWAMLTSANLSTQAWGSVTNDAGEVRLCSYEIGVVVWPGLWDGEGKSAEMVPVFKKDMPEDGNEDVQDGTKKTIRVGWRMPYDLPLAPYGRDEMPWCATAPCDEPDWMGRVWPGFGAR